MKTSKKQRLLSFYARTSALGFDAKATSNLLKIERTLSRWSEKQCNGDIERDETTGKPSGVFTTIRCERVSYKIADLEAGALRRLKEITDARNAASAEECRDSGKGREDTVLFYHQTDPRGCALYLIRSSALGANNLDSCYSSGLAVCL